MSDSNVTWLIIVTGLLIFLLASHFLGYLKSRSADQVKIAEAKAREAEAQAKPADPGPDNK